MAYPELWNLTGQEQALAGQRTAITAYLTGMLYGGEERILHYIAEYSKFLSKHNPIVLASSVADTTPLLAYNYDDIVRVGLILQSIKDRGYVRDFAEIHPEISACILIAAKQFISAHQYVKQKLEILNKPFTLLSEEQKNLSVTYGTTKYLYDVLIPLYQPEVSTFLAQFLGLKVAAPLIVLGSLATSYPAVAALVGHIPDFIFPVIPVGAVVVSYAIYVLVKKIQARKRGGYDLLPTTNNLNGWDPEYRPLSFSEQQAFATRWGWAVTGVVGVIFNALRVVLEHWASSTTEDGTKAALPPGISDAVVLVLTYQITRRLYLYGKEKAD